MFNFLQGVKNAITQKQLAKDQVLYSTTTGELFFDIKDDTENTITRYVVRDPLAQSLDGQTILIL